MPSSTCQLLLMINHILSLPIVNQISLNLTQQSALTNSKIFLSQNFSLPMQSIDGFFPGIEHRPQLMAINIEKVTTNRADVNLKIIVKISHCIQTHV